MLLLFVPGFQTVCGGADPCAAGRECVMVISHFHLRNLLKSQIPRFKINQFIHKNIKRRRNRQNKHKQKVQKYLKGRKMVQLVRPLSIKARGLSSNPQHPCISQVWSNMPMISVLRSRNWLIPRVPLTANLYKVVRIQLTSTCLKEPDNMMIAEENRLLHLASV